MNRKARKVRIMEPMENLCRVDAMLYPPQRQLTRSLRVRYPEIQHQKTFNGCPAPASNGKVAADQYASANPSRATGVNASPSLTARSVSPRNNSSSAASATQVP